MKLIKEKKIFALFLIVFGLFISTGTLGYIISSDVYKRDSGIFYRENDSDDALRIYFISAANNHSLTASGDAILLEKADSSGKYHFGLIDTGHNSKYVSGLDEKIKSFLTEHMAGKADTAKSYNGSTGTVVDKYVLDFLLLTHSDGDHLGNAAYLVDNFKFKNVYLKDILYELNLSSDETTIFYGNLVAKILDQNARGNDDFKTLIYGLDEFNKYSDSKDFCTLEKVSSGNYKMNDTASNGYAKTPDICRLLVEYYDSYGTNSDYNVSYWLKKMSNIQKNVDYIPFSEMSSRSIDFAGANIDLFGLIDNELLTTEYLTTAQYNKYKQECPYYPYWPDYWDKTGSTLHSSEKNENYSSSSSFYHYSNYFAKYDVYDPDNGKNPTYSGPLNENVRSIGMLISVGNKRAVLTGDLMNYVRYANDTSSAENYLANNFAYCGYEDALASAIAKKINSSNITSTAPLYIDFVKLSHHGLWYSNTLDYLNKLRPRYTITPRNSNVSIVGDFSKTLASGREITATINGKTVYPYGKGASYNYGFLNWYSVDDASSMVVRMDEDGVSVYPESFTSISIKTMPSKTDYSIGENIDPSGMVLNAVYQNTTGVIESGYTISPSSFDSAGTKTVTVTFGNSTTTYSVNVSGNAVAGTCSNLTYTGSSQTLVTSGTNVSYENNSGIDAGTYTVTATATSGYTFSDGSSSKEIKCTIEKATPNIKLSSNSGSAYVGEKLNFTVSSPSTGLYSVKSNDSSVATVSIVDNNVTIEAVGVGTTKIVVTQGADNNYYSSTGQYTVTVNENGSSDTAQIGNCTNPVYNGSAQTIINAGVGVSYDRFKGTSAGNYTITATTLSGYMFADGTTTKEVTCSIEKATPSVELSSNSGSVYVDGSLNFSVTLSDDVTYTVSSSDTSVAIVSKDGNNVIIKGVGVGNASIKVITTSNINYKSVSKTYSLVVKEASLTGITVDNKPNKLEYYVNESLDLAGLKVVAHYDDGNSFEVSDYECSPKTLTTVGSEVITISYNGKKATFEVNVKAIELASISIKDKPKLINYYKGEKFDSSGLSIYLNYNNGKIDTITSGFTTSVVDGTVLDSVGVKEINVSYNGFKTTFDINVLEAVVDSVIIKSLPNKTNYVVGEKFDSTGLTLTVIKSDLTKMDVSDNLNLSLKKGTVFETEGTKTISVEYEGTVLTFDVYVKKVEKVEAKADSYKAKVYVGDKFDSSNIVLLVSYSDGTSEEITSGFDIDVDDDFTFEKTGKQYLKVTYGDVTFDLEVQVLEKEKETVIVNPNTGRVLVDVLLIFAILGFGWAIYSKKISKKV